MTWTDIDQNWSGMMARLQHRFPGLDIDSVSRKRMSHDELTRHLAMSNDLTAREAEEALEDWMAQTRH